MSDLADVLRKTTGLLEALRPWETQRPAVRRACVDLTFALATLVESPAFQPDMAAAKDAELGARVGHGPGRRADRAQSVREQSLEDRRLK